MKTFIAVVAAIGLGSVAATIWIGTRLREPTVVANPYEEGLRYDETTRRARESAAAAARRATREGGLDDAARVVEEGGKLELEVEPQPPRAMSELTLTVRASRGGAPVDEAEVSVALTMPGMYMGENRVVLSPQGGGVYRGKGTVVRCPSGKRTWQADVTARPKDGGPPLSGRFTFEAGDP